MMRGRWDSVLSFVAKSVGIHYLSKTVHGTSWKLPVEAMSLLYFLHRVNFIDNYEGEYYEAVMETVKPGATVFDVGAFIGLYALGLSAEVGPQGTVVCFEPNPHNAAILQKTLRANAVHNVILEQQALGKSDGQVELWIRGASSTSSLHAAVVMGRQPLDKCVVRITRLDDYVARTHLVPHVLKFDVEGAEIDVLQGARETLTRHDVRLCGEIHPAFLTAQGSSTEEVFALLDELGYTVDREFKGTPSQAERPFGIVCSHSASWS